MKPYIEISSRMVQKDKAIKEPDFVVVESVLELRVNNKFLAIFICSPGLEQQLALGYLISSGFLQSRDEITKLEYADYLCRVELKNDISLEINKGFSQLRRFYESECSALDVLYELENGGDLPYITKSISVKIQTILNASRTLRDSQTVFQKTGATHAALIFDLSSQKTHVAEDIGRHNAVDKVIGLALEENFLFSDSFLFVSGRLTADMVSKCAWCGIPLVISNSATTNSGVKFAKKSNITLVGFQRGTRFRIYNKGVVSIIV